MTSGGRMYADPDLFTGRLFFAVPVPGLARAPLEAALPELARAVPAARIAAPNGWHLTLAFLGQVRAEHSADVLAVGEAGAAAGRPATLRLDGAGAFPNARRARVLWAGVAGDVDALGAVAAALADGCRQAGLRVEDRPFSSHLTIARLSTPAPLPQAALDLVAAAADAGATWEARELCCYRSTLSNRGARYTVVRTFPLRSATH